MSEHPDLSASTTAFASSSGHFTEGWPLPILAVEGSNHVVREANASFLRLASVGRSDLVGCPFVSAIPEARENGCAAMLDRVYRTGASETLHELQHRATPAAFWTYHAWAVAGTRDRSPGLLIHVSDSTDTAVHRRQAQSCNESLLVSAVRQHELTDEAEAMGARLTAAIKEKEYFIAVLSHELRTPLTPVLLAANLLRDDARLEPATRRIMDMIHRNITLEARLIDDLLDMTRIDRGQLKLVLEPVDLRDVVARALELSRADLKSGRLALDEVLFDEPLMVRGDPGRLLQVVSNIFRNAIKFTPEGGRICVYPHRDGDACALTITDTGAGIEPEFLSRAFDAFEQDNKTSTRQPGLGLGLAISRTIVELHHGAITARSDGIGKGASFTVRLPALRDEAPPSVPPLSPPAKIGSLRILLVEDHVDSAEMMRALLEADGHTVSWAGDVAGGMHLVETETFDVLLSDLGLPDGSGLDLMRKIRQSGSTLRGIVLSGYGQDDDIARSLEAGFGLHLVKPCGAQQLTDAIVSLRL